MRILVVLLTLFGAGVLRAQTPVLDARTPNGVTRSGGYSSVKDLAFGVTITDLPDQSYFIGDMFEYEVEITNTGQTSVKVPWTTDAVWGETGGEHAIEASVALTVTNGAGIEQHVGARYMYGSEEFPATFRELQPGAAVRIQLRGYWSFAGTEPSQYLMGKEGRLTVRAGYQLKENEVMWTTQLSPSRELTLVLR